MAIHFHPHAMTSAEHTATNWSLFHSNDSAAVVELALGAANAPLLGAGVAAAPIFGTLLFASAPVTAVGETPVAGDIAAWANNTLGIIVGTTARVFKVFKDGSGNGFSVELTALE